MKRLIVAAAFVLGTVPMARPATAPMADWPQWQGPDRTGMSKETGLLKEWPANGPSVIWSSQSLGNGYGSVAVAGERIFLQGMIGGNSTVFALNRADGKGVWSKALGRAESNDQGPGPARHADGRRRSPLRAHRERRPRVPQDRRHRGVAAQHPEGLRRAAAPLADQRVTAGRRPAPDRQPRRSGRRHGEARQDDGQDRVAEQGSERCRRLLVADRRRRGRRAHLHDADVRRRRRRARVGRQADVALREGREPHREHHDADLLRQQGLLHLRLRHGRRAARADRAERRGEGEGRSTSRAR